MPALPPVVWGADGDDALGRVAGGAVVTLPSQRVVAWGTRAEETEQADHVEFMSIRIRMPNAKR